MLKIPLSSKIYSAIIFAGTVFLLAWDSRRSDGWWNDFDVELAIVIAVLLILVEKFKIELPHSTFHLHLSVGSILSLAACLVFPPIVAAGVVMISTLVDDIWERLRPIQILINATVLGLSAFTAAAAYGWLANEGETPLASLRNMGASVVASFAYTLVNTTLLAIVVAPVVQESLVRLWKSNFGAAPLFVALPLIGSLVPVVAQENPLAVPILLVPLLGAHYSQRALRRSQTETQLTIESLVDALEVRDSYTHNHSIRVTQYVEAIIAEVPHLPLATRKMVIDAARVHDIGKVGVRDASLLKAGKLTDEEFNDIKRHPGIGADLIGSLELYRRSVPIVRHHHERWDGRGYPDGLEGDEIPLGSRIIAVADSFDAMTSNRPYRRAMSHEAALAEIVRNSGTQFDPEIVEAFQRALSKPIPVTEQTATGAEHVVGPIAVSSTT
jgi:HD-GYP domain-containing protein (c-di-GMP phosphodiesterase class II)